MEKLAEDIWVMPFELKALGVNVGRNVTVIRLSSGELLLHSTAPFSQSQMGEIRSRGEVRWITDPMVDHDTYSRQGQTAFPSAAFLVSEGFPEIDDLNRKPLMPVPNEWLQEVEVVRLEGASSFNEHVFFHLSSRTLIVCDLLMNFPKVDSLWSSALLRIGLGPERAPGTSRRLKLAIKDEQAFRASVRKVMEWPFDKVVVGHGEPIRDDAYDRCKRAFELAGWL
ncbi:hypothetical protein [Pelagicoccus sp. SDUM812003]|uniref:hypothetical protein n=1 Tax=Pelagicoccus sp. SDUM812003 TaxID=3041267 RepID=UPI00280F4EDE|nr:hypothetical protein [Pelagicoccus sp. SDUM812003]MDQ8201814.1 hypothetical protein [Pelagicoccus sp. SDUM812003]